MNLWVREQANVLAQSERGGTSMTKDEAMKLALKSIRELVVDESDDAPALQGVRMRKQKAEKALREALAQPEQEPRTQGDKHDQ